MSKPARSGRCWPSSAGSMPTTLCAWLEVIGYNTNLVKPEDAPKSYADLLNPKWQSKIVKGHPAYSGAILTNTYLWVRDLGWPYLEKLAQQKVMQVQSAAAVTRMAFDDLALPFRIEQIGITL